VDSDAPIACSLGGSDLQARYRDLGEFGRANLIGRATDEHGERLTFRRTVESERRLRAIVAAEEECCPFLGFELVEAGEGLELRISSTEDGRPVAAGLAAAFD
jgi:hypothetical protein